MAATSTPPTPAVPADVGESSWRWLIEPFLIALLALTLNLAGNGRVGLWDRDEPRYAGCVREMRNRGDWMHPTFNGEPRYQKPVLIYWLMRGGLALGGDNPFGARLVSAIAGTATCLVTWFMGRRMLGNRAARLAALMLATAPIMVVESKLATTDATLTLWLVCAQFCLWELAQRSSRRVAVAFWLLLGLATLTKGPVGIGLLAASGLVSWWWGGPTACWSRLHWRWGLVAFALVTVPWFAAVGIASHGEFFRVAVGEQLVTRVTRDFEKHPGFPGFYIVTTLGTFHPWSALLPAGMLAAWRQRKQTPLFGFLLGWVVGPLILLECVQTKLVHYFLPAIPACVLLAAWLVVALVDEEVNLRRWSLGRLGVGILGGTAFVFTIALIAAAMVMPPALRLPLAVLAIVLITGSLFALQRLFEGATERAVFGLAATWAIIMLGLGGWLLPSAEPYRMSRIVADRMLAHVQRTKLQPVLHAYHEPSLIYGFGTPIPLVRKWEVLYPMVVEHKALLTVILPEELKGYQQKQFLDVELLDRVEGFNLGKGQSESLQFLIVRERQSGQAAGPKQTLVK